MIKYSKLVNMLLAYVYKNVHKFILMFVPHSVNFKYVRKRFTVFSLKGRFAYDYSVFIKLVIKNIQNKER